MKIRVRHTPQLRYQLFLLLLMLPVMLLARQQVWVIDAGHGGNDHGCETGRAMEKDINLKVAKRVAELVKANIPDVKVVMTREYDKYLTLDQRCVIANNAKADLFVSVHVNYAPGTSTLSGTETFYGPQNATEDKQLEKKRKKNIQKSELLAWMMQKYYGMAGRPISRGVKRERYYVVVYTEMPSILTEIGFISTPSEEAYMTSKEGSEEIAQCIYKGLKDYNETVNNDKVQSTLAQLRRTGGKTQNNTLPNEKGPEKLVDFAKSEPVKAEQTKTEPAKTEQAKTDLVKAEQAKSEPVKAEQKKTETVKAEQTKVEQTKIEPAKNEANGKDIAKTEPKKTELKKTESKKTEAKKTEAEAFNPITNDGKDKLLAGTVEPEELDETLLFSVQIFSLRAKLDINDARFKGQKDILVVEKDGLYKYLCGTTGDYPGARKLLAKVRETFPDAFLVAYKGGRQISMSDAIELLPK